MRHTGPTFAGDTLYSETTVLETTASKSKGDRGVIYVETRGLNQRGEEVMILRRRILVRERAPPEQAFMDQLSSSFTLIGITNGISRFSGCARGWPTMPMA